MAWVRRTVCASASNPARPIPPSLVNIYKEMQSDLGITPARHGFLEHWAKQGVLLLNAVLTVQMAMANSHQGKGWEQFTDAVIRAVNDQPHSVVFILWGSYAQKKSRFCRSESASGAEVAASVAFVGA
ncbi:MAG: hypothetical protein WDN06_19945 [Asticcacaulis sp.]